jgi:hypothetical protein
MIDQEKLQRGRAWGYVVGIVAMVAVLAWRFVTR